MCIVVQQLEKRTEVGVRNSEPVDLSTGEALNFSVESVLN